VIDAKLCNVTPVPDEDSLDDRRTHHRLGRATLAGRRAFSIDLVGSTGASDLFVALAVFVSLSVSDSRKEESMPQPEHYDVLILDSGQGGKRLAWHLARSGQRVAVVERRWVGGCCPAVACLPSKNEIWSARVAHLARHAAQFC
jgi:hypothetical protein